MTEIESDFLRFYDIDLDESNVEVDVICSRKIFRLLPALFTYGGALTALAERESEKRQKKTPQHLQGTNVKEVSFDSVTDLPANDPIRMAMEDNTPF